MASANGGVYYVQGKATPSPDNALVTINDCKYYYNTATIGNIFYFIETYYAKIKNCKFIENEGFKGAIGYFS